MHRLLMVGFALGFGVACVGGTTDTHTTDSSTSTTFACGTTATCLTGKEYCKHASGGARPETGTSETWECIAYTGACAATPTCACLATDPEASSGRCTEDGTGGVTVTFEYP
jgi:hypothetical protein